VTFVSQPGAPGGAANTLQIRINDVLWHEVPTLYGQADSARVFKTTLDNDGVMTARTGDNRTGARVPTGRNNVVATYRQGLGREGNVSARSLKILLDSLKGLKRVINPLAAEGGTDPESAASLRANLPNTVRTFGRIVSLRDFEDAAREFVGVAKARAAMVWDGEEQVVQLTVAGDAGATVEPGGTTHTNLVLDLNSRRDPHRRLLVNSYQRVPIVMAAHVWVEADSLPETIQADVAKAIVDLLDFENVDLGQTIYASDLLRAMQQVKGVVAVDLVQFHELSGSPSGQDVAEYVRIGPHQLVAIDNPSQHVTITTEVMT
jgi:predicted phage baseplate assembly protein